MMKTTITPAHLCTHIQSHLSVLKQKPFCKCRSNSEKCNIPPRSNSSTSSRRRSRSANRNYFPIIPTIRPKTNCIRTRRCSSSRCRSSSDEKSLVIVAFWKIRISCRESVSGEKTAIVVAGAVFKASARGRRGWRGRLDRRGVEG
jgi:hypothetical protein